MNTREFLDTVVSTPRGWFLLATRSSDGWKETWHDWPTQLDTILDVSQQYAAESMDVYFSAHLFSEKRSLKANVLPSRTIQADLDYADIMTLPVLPTVVVGTSPAKHQGYWVLDSEHSPTELEDIARRIAYGVRDCDRTGWPAGHRMRLPGTQNFKYLAPALIEVVGHQFRTIDPEMFNLFPALATSVAVAEADAEWIAQMHLAIDVGPIQLMHEAHMSNKIITQYNKPGKDRSALLWALMMDAFRHELTRDQVYWLAYNSANNKFQEERRYSAIADLRKDVLRAEAVALDRTLDLRAAIMDLRMVKGLNAVQRQQKMAHLVITRMREDGELIHTRGGQLWFLRKTTGRPVEITERSLVLDAYLAGTFGLNATEQHSRFVKRELMSVTRNTAASADLVTLSHYEATTKTLLLHTGGRDVLHIKAGGIEVHPNGYAHAVFMLDENIEPFRLGKSSDLGGRTWYDTLFAAQMKHIEGNLSTEEAVILLRAWFLLLLFRAQVPNRPLLTVLGQPGSGKTTTAKKLYRLLYGAYRNVTTVESAERFDTATVNLPFVCFDGVDSYQSWLVEKLSQAAAVTDVQSRVLYTDTDTITQRRQAMLMLTAHNPRFTREDVVDRMILITLHRLPHWLPESSILSEVTELRGALWADIVRDVQNVLATPMPKFEEAPQFRIEDYAHYGMWFSLAAGLDKVFAGAIRKLMSGQRGMNLETDQVLVAAIGRWLRVRAEKGHDVAFLSQSQIWAEMVLCSADPSTFQKMYRNVLYFGRKLLTMQDSLKEVYDIEVKYDTASGARVWKIGPKT
jgi:hypothetical protein